MTPSEISFGSFVRLSLKVREKWVQENVSCGLQLTKPAQVGLAAAQMYSKTEPFWFKGVGGGIAGLTDGVLAELLYLYLRY